MEQYLLGIDIGTTGAKALLFSTSGAFLAQAYAAYPLSTPQLGWQEQRAEDWWDAVVQTVRSVCGDPAVARNVISISLSTQGGTFVPVDAHGHALRPAIVWSDSRTQQERDAFLREVGPAETMYQKTGWPLGLALLAQDIRWMRTHEPELFSKTALFLSVPSFLSYRMTGIAACDLSNAGIDQLCDVRKGCYDEQLLQFAGVRASQLPVLVRSGEPIGHLTPAAAKTLGLETGCVLIAGAHDQYAAALGAGMTHDGDILIGSGTCWVVTMLRSCPDFPPALRSPSRLCPDCGGRCSRFRLAASAWIGCAAISRAENPAIRCPMRRSTGRSRFAGPARTDCFLSRFRHMQAGRLLHGLPGSEWICPTTGSIWHARLWRALRSRSAGCWRISRGLPRTAS